MKKSETRSFRICFLYIVILFIGLNELNAQQEISDSLVKQRIQYIKNAIEESTPGINCWWYGWIAGYGAATIGQGVVYLSTDKKALKQDMALGAASTVLGVAQQLVTPILLPGESKHLKLASENTPEERLIKLSQAEDLLKMVAQREKEARSWKMHALCGAVNVSSGLITWFAFKRTVWDGLGNFAINTAISETQIWTQPTRAIKAHENYLKQQSPEAVNHYTNTGINWYVLVYPGRVGIRLIF